MIFDPLLLAGRALRKLGSALLDLRGLSGTWIDVGAHQGESSLMAALENPGLRVYAVEPNIRAAARLFGAAPNYVVLPIAIAEHDGAADFHLNASEMSSSLLAINEDAKRSWAGMSIEVVSTNTVPTLRLDTLMDLLEIQNVDFLKIDAQGMDLAVLRSAGQRILDIAKVQLEVETVPVPFYVGSPPKSEVLCFLDRAGFTLIASESQTRGQEENLTFIRKTTLRSSAS
jgi:FkbM family methyltransferase